MSEPAPIATLRSHLPDRYLTPQDVAHMLSVPLETVYAWRRRRTGPPAFRIGKHLRYDPRTLAAWIEQQTHADQAA